MKIAMKFQNKTPEEIVRRYRRGMRLKQGPVILGLLMYTIFAIWGIWWNDMVFFDLLPMSLILFFSALFINVWMSLDFIALNAILNENCDPVTYAEVMRLLGQRRNRRHIAIAVQINEAAGAMWAGRFSEALELVRALPALTLENQISVIYIRFNCCIKLEDKEGVLQAKREAETLIPSIKKPALQKRGRKLLDVMAASIALRQGDYASFRRMEEARHNGFTANIQKVTSAFNLSKVDIAQGETQNAKSRLEYVAKAGGTLYVAAEARKLLVELEEFPYSERAEYPDVK